MKIISLEKNACVGEKANRLLLLKALGFQVPDSWVIENQSLLEYLHVTELLQLARFADRHQKDYEATHRQAILDLNTRAFPEQTFSFLEQYPKSQKWIVRSSHSCEDTHDHSLAGLFHSIVIFSSSQEMMHAIKEVCMQALSWDTQMELLKAGIDPLQFRPGVLIQPYIEAVRSGVFFSRNPRNPWSTERLCEWHHGDAKKIVDGDAVPHSDVWMDSPDDEQLAQVDREGARIAQALGCSVDCEWVWDGKGLYWVQARPIADPKIQLADRLDHTSILSREDMKERFPAPLSRMGWSVLEKILEVNLQSIEHHFGLIVPKLEQLVINDSGVIYSNRDFFQLKGVKWKKSYLKRFLRPGRLLSLLKQCFTHRKISIASLLVKDLYLEQSLQNIVGHWNENEKVDLKGIASLAKGSDQDLIRAFTQLEDISQSIFQNDMATFVLREVYYKAFKEILGSDDALQQALNKERTMNHELFHDCEELRAVLSLNRSFLDQLKQGSILPELLSDDEQKRWQRFIEKWGAMNESWDVLEPSWKEDPRSLHTLLTRSGVRSRSRPSTPTIPENLLEKYDLQEIFNKFISIVKTDDQEHYFGAKLLDLVRELILESGKRLHENGVLTNTMQVFGLTLDELKRFLLKHPGFSIAPYACQHMQILARAKHRNPPDYLNQTPTIAEEFNGRKGGVPVSEGRVEGIIKIVRSREDLDCIDEETILALISPNPAFIPLFSQIKGLVCETGGLLSHSFVVAREIMLPAVTQVKGLTSQFVDGERVLIDGATGIIEKVNVDA